MEYSMMHIRNKGYRYKNGVGQEGTVECKCDAGGRSRQDMSFAFCKDLCLETDHGWSRCRVDRLWRVYPRGLTFLRLT